MQQTVRRAVAAWAALAFVPALALAQAVVPAKVLHEGSPDGTVRTSGSVTVKVLVEPDGKPVIKGVLHSTNRALNPLAVSIARNSTYRAARRDGKPIRSYYEYALNFKVTGGGVGGGIGRYDAMIRRGEYDGAQRGLTAYLAHHPGDVRALTLLGVADTFLSEYASAASAFDGAGSVDPIYRSIAGKAYAEHAVALSNAKNYGPAITSAGKAVALTPSFATYNTLGFAQLQSGDAASAIPNLTTARTDAVRDGADPKQRALIAANLAAAYVATNDLAQARAYADEAAKLDPSATQGQEAVASVYAKQAAALPNPKDAAALYERAASIAPTRAVTMYGLAASAYLDAKPKPQAGPAKAEADKALALDANDASANLAEGVALADMGKKREARPYLEKADASAKATNQPAVAANVEKVLQQLGFAKK